MFIHSSCLNQNDLNINVDKNSKPVKSLVELAGVYKFNIPLDRAIAVLVGTLHPYFSLDDLVVVCTRHLLKFVSVMYPNNGKKAKMHSMSHIHSVSASSCGEGKPALIIDGDERINVVESSEYCKDLVRIFLTVYCYLFNRENNDSIHSGVVFTPYHGDDLSLVEIHDYYRLAAQVRKQNREDDKVSSERISRLLATFKLSSNKSKSPKPIWFVDMDVCLDLLLFCLRFRVQQCDVMLKEAFNKSSTQSDPLQANSGVMSFTEFCQLMSSVYQLLHVTSDKDDILLCKLYYEMLSSGLDNESIQVDEFLRILKKYKITEPVSALYIHLPSLVYPR